MHGATVYFVNNAHEVLAVNTVDGSIRWRSQLPDVPAGARTDCMIIAQNTLVVGHDELYGLDPATGTVRWKAVPSQGYLPGYFCFTTDGIHVYTGSPSGTLYAFVAATGEERWATNIVPNERSSIYTVDFVDNILYASVTAFRETVLPDTGAVVALDAATGNIRWLRWLPHSEPGSYTAVVAAAVAGPYVFTAADDGIVYALHQSDGSIAWTAPGVITSEDRDRRPVIVSGSTLLVASTTDILVAYETVTGKERWRMRTGNGSTRHRLWSDEEYFYFLDGGGGLNVVSVADGKRVARQPRRMPNAYMSRPSVDATSIYIAASDGFYAFKKP